MRTKNYYKIVEVVLVKEKLRQIRICEEKLREVNDFIKDFEKDLDRDRDLLDKYHNDEESVEHLTDSINYIENKLDGLYIEQSNLEDELESLRQVAE